MTYSGVTAGLKDLDTTFCGQRLRARYDSLCAVNYTPSAGELCEFACLRRVEGLAGEGHGESRAWCGVIDRDNR